MQCINLGLENADEEIRRVLEIVRMEDNANIKFKSCSLGMKQRIGIAMALLGDPALLILDEPINGLDTDGMRMMREILVDITQKYGCTVLISSHFLAIAAVIPAMVSAMTMMPDQNGNTMKPLYSNVWQIIAAEKSLYVIETVADYANMNMVFIFGGIMVSIFSGHDYKSGYVKQLFTTHAKKQDYMISKTLVCAFAMACMCITYLIGGMLLFMMVSMISPLSSTFMNVILCLAGGILFAASLGAVSKVILQKTSLV